MIIDLHTHVPPEEQWTLFLQHCRDNGVTLAVTSGLGSWAHYPDAADVRRANDAACRLAAFAQGMVLWFAYLNPQHDDWPAELQRTLAAGACGIKLWVSLKDPETGSLERVPPVLAAAQRLHLPVLIHTFQRVDDNLPGEITMAEFAELARRFPELPLIAAHAGGNWRQSLRLLGALPNVSVDISGGYPETGMVEALVADLGVERVLFGSDALGRSIASQLAKVTLAQLAATDQRRILWDNAARLLGISDSQVAAAERRAAGLPATAASGVPALDEDHFCFSGPWPFRSSPCPTPTALAAALPTAGLRRAYVADAGSVFALDVLGANQDFERAARGLPGLAPLAAMVPYAPNAQPILDAAVGRFAGGILYPYLHNWRLDDPAYAAFFAAAAAARFPLWVNACTADSRFRHRGTLCREVSVAELLHFAQSAPPNAYVIQGAGLGPINACLERDAGTGQVRFEVSRLTDSSTDLTSIVGRFGWERLVLGSEFPFRDLRSVRSTAQVLCAPRPGR
jgi:predicted TIM-barrel fold metal-dependent hydrolase